MWSSVFTQPQRPRTILERMTTLLVIMKALFTALLRKIMPDQTLTETRGKAVLITGCDSGFGYATALRFDALGFKVFACCLDVHGSGSVQLEKLSSSRLTTIQLDITHSEQLEQARIIVEKSLDGADLWGLVNNAGICTLGNLELSSWEETSKLINVNFVGTLHVTKTFLPLIRRSRGRIVNVGSINGEVPMPHLGVYNATKAAIRMYTDTLQYEMRKWGVSVSLIAPAGFKTGILSANMHNISEERWNTADKMVKEDYGREYFDMRMRASERIKLNPDLTPVTSCITHAITSAYPKSVYRVGHGAVILPMLCSYTPSAFRDWFCTNVIDFCPDTPAMLKS